MDHTRKTIYGAGFLFSLSTGLALYINSSFIASFVGEKLTGLVFTLASLGSIIAVLIAPKIFKRSGGHAFLLGAAFLDALSFLTLALVHNTFGAIIVFIIGLSLNTLVLFSLDELLKIFSLERETGRTRGMYLAVCNFALLIAQFGHATILSALTFRAIYFVSFAITMVFFLVAFFTLAHMPDPAYDKVKDLKYVRKFFKRKNLSRAYGISFLMQLFYSWMIIYTPIYLYAHLGFSWSEIGFIFMIMLIPFLFVPIYAGKYADKIGERNILMIGFFIMGISALSLFFVHERILFLWALLLFGTRIGASAVESMSDTYFFKHIAPENEEFIGVYRSAAPIADILGPLFASIIFIFVPSFNYIFAVLSGVMLYGIYLASTIRKTDI